MSTKPLPQGVFAFFWHLCRDERIAFLFISLSPIIMLLENTLWPYLLGKLIDAISQYQGDRSNIMQEISTILWWLGISWMLMIVTYRALDFSLARLWPRYIARVRLALFEAVSAHSHQYFADRFAGTLSNKISDMVNALTNLFFNARWLVVSSIASCLGVLTIIYFVLPSFSLVLLIWIAMHMGICLYFSKKADVTSQMNAEDKSAISGKIVDVFTNITNVRLFGRRLYEFDQLRQFQNREVQSHHKMLFTMSVAKAVIEIPGVFMVSAMITLLLRGWMQGEVTSGQFVFVFYASFNILMLVWHFSMELPSIFRDVGVARQALSLILEPYTVQDKPHAPALALSQGQIVFDHVHFEYGPNAKVFSDLCLSIEPGEKIGLVGFSGSGKSTLVNLLLRFYDINSGEILLDGQSVSEVSHKSLSEHIAMIPQDTTLFHRSLLENIRYGHIQASDAQVIEAAKKAHCHEFISQMSQQYATLVGERGVKLSGGQRQRIAIARAILKDAPILILDEATSALDSVTEGFIQESLNLLMKGRTCVVIAHRLSTLTGMDRILVFDKGRIIESGHHSELIKNSGHYAHLWHLQQDGFVPESELTP
jgi:ATP-binding cassette subfamily B protein